MIVVHTGFKKCGSASIQQFLSANDGALRCMSVDYPRIGREHRPSHANFAAELKGGDNFDPSLGSLSDLAACWRSSPDMLKIISAETFETLGRSEIASLKRYLGAGESLRIVMVVRDLAELLRSLYVQRIKLGQKSFDFDRFFELRMVKGRVDYCEMARPWAELFGWENLRICTLGAGTRVDGDVIDDFLSASGVDPRDPRLQSLVRPGAFNVTGDWRVLEAIRALRRGDIPLVPCHPLNSFLARADRKFDQRCLERVGFEIGERRGWAGDKGNYLTLGQARRCLEVYSEAVAGLNERLSERLPMPQPLDEARPCERDFMPDAKQIPAAELMEFYDEMGECFARRAALEAAAKFRWRQAGLITAGVDEDDAESGEQIKYPVVAGRRLVVHIGLKKSGSASIQSFLAANAKVLRGLSIDYTRVGRHARNVEKGGSPTRKAHHSLAHEALGGRKFEPKGGSAADLGEYARSAKHEIVIVSSEMFEGCNARNVAKFYRLLGETGRRIQIILIIRDLISLLPSSYAQKVRYGKKTYDFDVFYEERIAESRVDYFETANSWAEVFGWENLTIRLLDRRLLANGDLIDDFLLAAGVEVNDPRVRTARRLGAQNETSGWKIIEASRALYGGRHGLSDDHPLARFAARASNLSNRKDIERAAIEVSERFGWLGDKGLYLQRNHAQRALDGFGAAITKLNERLSEPLPAPLDLEARGFVERPFLPSVEQIPASELRGFYDDVAETLLGVFAKRRTIKRKQADVRTRAAKRLEAHS